jgi:hypothetical protein
MYFKSEKPLSILKECSKVKHLKSQNIGSGHEKSFASSNSILTIFPFPFSEAFEECRLSIW